MNTLTDQALTDALTAAAGSFPDPAPSTSLLDEVNEDDVADPWWRRRAVQLGSVAAALLVAVLLVQSALPSVFSTEMTSRTSADGSRDQFGNPAELPGGDSGVGGTTGGATGSGGVTGSQYGSTPDTAGGPPVAAPQAATARNMSGGVPTSGQVQSEKQSTTAAQDTSRVVKTGSISLIVDEGKVGAALTKIRAVATSVRGFVAEEQSQEFGDDPSAVITLRVPVASFDSVMNQLRSKGFGAKVVSADSSGRDVTASYADTLAQLKSLQAARNRYLTILDRATTIGQVLQVQQRVDEVQAQIDRLEGSRRLLANQSDLATLTVSVAEKGNETLKTVEPSGFSKAWDEAKDGFISGVEGLLAGSGRALLVLIVGALLLLGGRFGWRVARRHVL